MKRKTAEFEKDALARDVDEAGELPIGSSRLEELLSQE